MSELSEGTLREHGQRLEIAILTEVVGLHPERLTTDKLILRMANGPDEADRVAVGDGLQELRRDGLIRLNGGVVEICSLSQSRHCERVLTGAFWL